MFYLLPKQELQVNKEMEILDELCTFRPELLVVHRGHSIPVMSHNEHQEYYDLINLYPTVDKQPREKLGTKDPGYHNGHVYRIASI